MDWAMNTRSITIAGAGITGLWQALTLARRGHRVRLIERTAEPFAGAASALAGAMLAPYCEAEAAEPVVRELGLASMAIWRETYPGVVANGTLVVAGTRDRAELTRFARMTEGFDKLDAAAVERDRAGPRGPLRRRPLLRRGSAHGPARGDGVPPRGSAARGRRGIARHARGRRMRTTPMSSSTAGASPPAASLPTCAACAASGCCCAPPRSICTRPVRLLHPRHPLYVVPWGDGLFMVGATVIESDDAGPVTVRSALELLGSAYALHPAFAEAQIVDMGAGVRPALRRQRAEDRRARPHPPRQRPLPPRLPDVARARRPRRRLPRDRRHRQPGVRGRRLGEAWA